MKLARLLPFALTLLLAACGGDGPTPVPPTEPTPPVSAADHTSRPADGTNAAARTASHDPYTSDNTF